MDLAKAYIAQSIREKSAELGFDDIGFSPAEELIDDKERLKKWLEKGYNAGMGYMANHFDKRVNPALLVEGSKSVITVVQNYYQPKISQSQEAPQISRYAYGEDYHKIIKDKLSELLNYIREHLYPDLQGRFFTDSAPILEKSLAVKAGLGWIGKNSLLIHRKLGSFIFIGEILVNLDLTYNNKIINDGCGGCTRCIRACPTGAILPGKQIDANKCISYLTIENKDDIIPESFHKNMNKWIFGCDICQEVCPWNKKLQNSDEAAYYPSEKLQTMTMDDWNKLSPKEFSLLFKNSPVKRAKYEGIKRNLVSIQ